MSLAALTDSTTAIGACASTLRADFGQFDKDHIGQFRLGVVCDADADVFAFAANPFMSFCVKEIVGNVHDCFL